MNGMIIGQASLPDQTYRLPFKSSCPPEPLLPCPILQHSYYFFGYDILDSIGPAVNIGTLSRQSGAT